MEVIFRAELGPRNTEEGNLSISLGGKGEMIFLFISIRPKWIKADFNDSAKYPDSRDVLHTTLGSSWFPGLEVINTWPKEGYMRAGCHTSDLYLFLFDLESLSYCYYDNTCQICVKTTVIQGFGSWDSDKAWAKYFGQVMPMVNAPSGQIEFRGPLPSHE